MRGDRSGLLLVLVGFAAGYAGRWLPELVPAYADWSTRRKLVVRIGVMAALAGLAWAFIDWRTSQSARHADPGPYWFLWSIGLVVGLILDEVHAAVDRMFS